MYTVYKNHTLDSKAQIVKMMGKHIPGKHKYKTGKMAILISEQNSLIQEVTKIKEGHSQMITKRSIHQ